MDFRQKTLLPANNWQPIDLTIEIHLMLIKCVRIKNILRFLLGLNETFKILWRFQHIKKLMSPKTFISGQETLKMTPKLDGAT